MFSVSAVADWSHSVWFWNGGIIGYKNRASSLRPRVTLPREPLSTVAPDGIVPARKTNFLSGRCEICIKFRFVLVFSCLRGLPFVPSAVLGFGDHGDLGVSILSSYYPSRIFHLPIDLERIDSPVSCSSCVEHGRVHLEGFERSILSCVMQS